MKKIQSLSYLATLAIALGMISWGSALHAQTTPSTTPDRQAQQPSSSPDTTPTQQTPQTQPTPSPEMPPSSQQAPSAQTPGQSQGQTPGQTPDASTPQSGSTSGSTSNSGSAAATGSDSQTFSGTVVKQGDKYVLRDDSGQTYDIDHQTEVSKFDGKRVRVQGTLDPTGKKIMVK